MLLSAAVERARVRNLHNGFLKASHGGVEAVDEEGGSVVPSSPRAVQWTVLGAVMAECPDDFVREVTNRLMFAHMRHDVTSSSLHMLSALSAAERDAVFVSAIETIRAIEKIAEDADHYGFHLRRGRDLEWAQVEES